MGAITESKTLFDAATTTGSSGYFNVGKGLVNIQGFLSNTTTPAATIVIEGTNEDTPANPVTIKTLSLSGAAAADGYTFVSGYYWVRARISAITGTNATCTVLGRVFQP